MAVNGKAGLRNECEGQRRRSRVIHQSARDSCQKEGQERDSAVGWESKAHRRGGYWVSIKQTELWRRRRFYSRGARKGKRAGSLFLRGKARERVGKTESRSGSRTHFFLIRPVAVSKRWISFFLAQVGHRHRARPPLWDGHPPGAQGSPTHRFMTSGKCTAQQLPVTHQLPPRTPLLPSTFI